MDVRQYHRLRAAIQDNAAPGRWEDVAPMADTLRALLSCSVLFSNVEVEATDDPDQMVIGLCEFRTGIDSGTVAGFLEDAWEDRLRYPFWEVHSTRASSTHVEFHGATRHSPVGHYVTFHVVARRHRIPAQRTGPTAGHTPRLPRQRPSWD